MARLARLTTWPPLPPLAHARRPTGERPFPLDQPGFRLFSKARHAIWHGVSAIGLKPGDEVLVPAYHHGSEVQALIEAGLVPRFYDSDSGLAPRPQELEALLTPRTRALHLTHFLGFPQDAGRWRGWCDQRELKLIEDAAQAWLARGVDGPVGAHGDLTIFCLYKTFGLPDGAAALYPGGADGTTEPRGLALPAVLRRHAMWLMSRSSAATRVVTARPRRNGEGPAPVSGPDIGLGDPWTSPSATTAFLLPRLPGSAAAETRRRNYSTLLDAVGEHVPAPFDRLPEGASPFAFPVRAEHKAALLDELKSAEVEPIDLWSTAHAALAGGTHPEAASRRETTVALPVHQELTSGDLRRIADTVQRAMAGHGA